MLHIGSGYIVPRAQVVMILDAQSADARALLSRMKKSAQLVRIDAGDKSIVVCAGRHGETCYLSPIIVSSPVGLPRTYSCWKI